MTREEYEDQRRRLEADAEDARKTVVNARANYERICDELNELRCAWRDQQRDAR